MTGRGSAATSAPAVAVDGERESRLVIVFFFACVLVLLLAVLLLLVSAAQSVIATRAITGFVMSIANAWHTDDSRAIQIMPFVGVFILAMTAPLRRTNTLFWIAMAVLFLIAAAYQFLIWQAGEGRWLFNTMIGTPEAGRTEVLRSFFETIRNGAMVLMASMLGLAINKDAKN